MPRLYVARYDPFRDTHLTLLQLVEAPIFSLSFLACTQVSHTHWSRMMETWEKEEVHPAASGEPSKVTFKAISFRERAKHHQLPGIACWDLPMRVMRVASVKTTLRGTESGKLSPKQPAASSASISRSTVFFLYNTCIKINTRVVRPRRTPFTLQTGMVTVLVGVLVVLGGANIADGSDGCAAAIRRQRQRGCAATPTPGSESFESCNSESNWNKTCFSSKHSASLRSGLSRRQ